MAKELLALVDAGTIRLIDVLILSKNEDGTADATELSDIEELGDLQALEAQLAELLAAEDAITSPPPWSPEAPRESSSGRTSGRRRLLQRRAAPAAG